MSTNGNVGNLSFMSVSKYPDVNENTRRILEKRYFHRDSAGVIIEDIDGMFTRVANFVASAERNFNTPHLYEAMSGAFFEMMRSLRFMPNTPTLTNSGRDRGQLAACYVLPTQDSMEGIMDTLKSQALVQKSGGGTGFSFSCIRERNALISSTGMKAAGPVPVIKLMNYLMSEFVTQGGVRFGANMGVLPVDHNDIEEFITFKSKDGSCASFNVSVAATDAFMKAVEEGGTVQTISRKDGSVIREIPAIALFDLIADYAWATGDPGILFIDTANKYNPTPQLGRLEATNPCGEQWLLPNEACTLGHMNLGLYFKDTESDDWVFKFDWEQYSADIKLGVRFLDNVIEKNYYALPEIERMHRVLNRKIGLGVMGFADLLKKFEVPYGSKKARDIGSKIARFHRQKADEASYNLGVERGSFGAFEGSAVQASGWAAMRNSCRTTVAPTGTTAIIANCASTGIEPDYALVLERHQAGMTMYEELPSYTKYFANHPNRNWISMYALKHGTLKGCDFVTPDQVDLFATANEISPTDHVLMQAAWQEHIDNAISKTVNLPQSASVQDIKDVYMLAWKTGCKGVTVYRHNSRSAQPLAAAPDPSVKALPEEPHTITISSEKCPECRSELEMSGGCETCKNCGFAVCKI